MMVPAMMVPMALVTPTARLASVSEATPAYGQKPHMNRYALLRHWTWPTYGFVPPLSSWGRPSLLSGPPKGPHLADRAHERQHPPFFAYLAEDSGGEVHKCIDARELLEDKEQQADLEGAHGQHLEEADINVPSGSCRLAPGRDGRFAELRGRV